jgi:hypothetical protein
MGCDEASRNLVKVLCLEHELESSEHMYEYKLMDQENDRLKELLNKHCLGKTLVSVCGRCEQNTANFMGDDSSIPQTYAELSNYPCCWETCEYVEIDEWAKKYRVDIKKLKRDHDAQSSTPLYTETDPSPTLPDDNDE